MGEGASAINTGMRVTCAINQPMPTADNPLYFEALGSERDGAFAEFCCVPAAQLYDVKLIRRFRMSRSVRCRAPSELPSIFWSAPGYKATTMCSSPVHPGGWDLPPCKLARQRGADVTAVSSEAKAGCCS